MLKKGHTIAYFMIISIAAAWGLSFISIKVSLTEIPPMSLGLYRFVIALGILYLLKQCIAPKERIAWRTVPLFAAAGFSGVTLYFFSENNGVKLLSASEASIIIGSIPVITMLAERFIFKNRLTLLQYAGAIVSFAGIWVIVSESLSISSGVRGYLYMLGAAVSWVVYSFLTRPLFKKHSIIVITFWQSFFGMLGFIPFAIAEHPPLGNISVHVWLHLLFLAVICTAVGYYFFVVALERLGVTVTSVFINLIPVVAVIAAYIFLGERLSTLQLCGGAVVVAGVYLVSLGGERSA